MIKIDNLTKKYGDLVVLKDLDLHVEEGEFVVLLGASGSGKSTLINLIAGFEQASEGSVVVNGSPVTDVDPGRCIGRIGNAPRYRPISAS